LQKAIRSIRIATLDMYTLFCGNDINQRGELQAKYK